MLGGHGGILEHVVNGRVVDQHVQMAEPGQGCITQGGDRVRVGHIEGQPQRKGRQCGGELGRRVKVEVGDDNVGPERGQCLAMLAAD